MAKQKTNSKKIIQLMFSQTKDFLYFSLLTLLIIVLEVLSILLLRGFINKVVIGKQYESISMYVAPFVITSIAIVSLMFVRMISKNKIIHNMNKELITTSYDSMLYAEMNELLKNSSEKNIKNLSMNCEVITQDFIGKNVLPFIEYLFTTLAVVITSLIIQPILGLITIISIPFYIATIKALDIISNKFNNAYKKSLVDNETLINTTKENIENIKLMNGNQMENEKFEDIVEEHAKKRQNKNYLDILRSSIVCVIYTGITVAIVMGVYGLLDQTITNIDGGAVVYFLIAIPVQMCLIYKSLRMKLSTNNISKEVNEIEEIRTFRSEVKSEPITNLDEIHTIKFKDVCYDGINQTSNDSSSIISMINFEIKKGEKLGILSTSKEEKSTIFKLLTKVLRLRDGSITINNCELQKINPIYLRSIITSIDSNSKVFNDTIKNNICYPYEFDEYKYNDALYKSGLKQLLPELSYNDETMLKDDKNDFNTRVVFANSFYKDSKIYILNDATIHVDAVCESDLINEVFKLKNKIVILETDKAYLLSKCDKILVIEDGKVIEYGLYSELISNRQSRFYKSLKTINTKITKIS